MVNRESPPKLRYMAPTLAWLSRTGKAQPPRRAIVSTRAPPPKKTTTAPKKQAAVEILTLLREKRYPGTRQLHRQLLRSAIFKEGTSFEQLDYVKEDVEIDGIFNSRCIFHNERMHNTSTRLQANVKHDGSKVKILLPNKQQLDYTSDNVVYICFCRTDINAISEEDLLCKEVYRKVVGSLVCPNCYENPELDKVMRWAVEVPRTRKSKKLPMEDNEVDTALRFKAPLIRTKIGTQEHMAVINTTNTALVVSIYATKHQFEDEAIKMAPYETKTVTVERTAAGTDFPYFNYKIDGSEGHNEVVCMALAEDQ